MLEIKSQVGHTQHKHPSQCTVVLAHFFFFWGKRHSSVGAYPCLVIFIASQPFAKIRGGGLISSTPCGPPSRLKTCFMAYWYLDIVHQSSVLVWALGGSWRSGQFFPRPPHCTWLGKVFLSGLVVGLHLAVFRSYSWLSAQGLRDYVWRGTI